MAEEYYIPYEVILELERLSQRAEMIAKMGDELNARKLEKAAALIREVRDTWRAS